MNSNPRSSEIHYPVASLIADRRSTRAYSSAPVSTEMVSSLFEAVRWAPSSNNEQPWVYRYVTSDQQEWYQQFTQVLSPSNQAWAGQAPLLVLSLARKTHQKNGQPNAYALYDVGGANALLALQAVHLGLQVRQMGGFDKQKAVETLNIPVDLEPVVIIAIGHPGDPALLPENLQVRERAARERFLQETFVQNGLF